MDAVKVLLERRRNSYMNFLYADSKGSYCSRASLFSVQGYANIWLPTHISKTIIGKVDAILKANGYEVEFETTDMVRTEHGEFIGKGRLYNKPACDGKNKTAGKELNMLDLAQYRKKIMSEEEAKREAENIAAIWAIEGMNVSAEEQKIMVDYLMGKTTDEEFRLKYLKA